MSAARIATFFPCSFCSAIESSSGAFHPGVSRSRLAKTGKAAEQPPERERLADDLLGPLDAPEMRRRLEARVLGAHRAQSTSPDPAGPSARRAPVAPWAGGRASYSRGGGSGPPRGGGC